MKKKVFCSFLDFERKIYRLLLGCKSCEKNEKRCGNSRLSRRFRAKVSICRIFLANCNTECFEFYQKTLQECLYGFFHGNVLLRQESCEKPRKNRETNHHYKCTLISFESLKAREPSSSCKSSGHLFRQRCLVKKWKHFLKKNQYFDGITFVDNFIQKNFLQLIFGLWDIFWSLEKKPSAGLSLVHFTFPSEHFGKFFLSNFEKTWNCFLPVRIPEK